MPRSFGGWCSSFRCERAAADLLFLICDLGAGGSASWVPAQASAAAERFGFEVRVELVEKAEGTGGREVFAIREVHGRAF